MKRGFLHARDILCDGILVFASIREWKWQTHPHHYAEPLSGRDKYAINGSLWKNRVIHVVPYIIPTRARSFSD